MAAKAQEARFRDRAELLDFLLEVTTATSAALDLDSLLASVADYVRQVIESDVVAILLYSERHRGLRVRHAIGLSKALVRDMVIPLDEGLTGVAASARMPVVVGDVGADPRYLPVLDAIQSEMAVPMTVGNRLVGVIDVQSARRNAYTGEDSALLQLIASRVSSFLLRAKLYRRLERSNRTLRTLSQLAQELSSILDVDELLDAVAKRIRTLVNYHAFSVLLHEPSLNALRHRFSIRYDEQVKLQNIPFGKGITGTAAASRQTVLVEDVLNDPRYIQTYAGTRSELAIPLVSQDQLVGVINLESERIGFFTEEHAQLLQLIAPQVTISIVNARLYEEISDKNERMEADLAAARRLQSVLLPREDPEIDGLEIGIGFRPAHEITGDVFDFFEQGGKAIISFGDVSGKSAAAALYSAMVTGLLRTLAPRGKSPAALMQALNDALMERSVAGKYLTLTVLQWTPSTGAIVLSNAAAIPPLVCRGGEIISPHIEGFPLGMFPGRSYEETTFQTQDNDVILLYSDGIQDQSGRGKKIYGEQRLAEFFRGLCHLPAQQIVDAILDDFDRFREGRTIQDDQTLVVLKVRPDRKDPAVQ
ncbi:MAG: GAF domain-containing protein [Acidobacteria bacterium]|nr:GAF domain-containing protein [Acidobacteriota bacterium]